ncbi:RNA 2'-phosphotransferase [Rhizobium lentis]|uniref:Probable RNA 2'-phosphotransferase n=1 Tax=Rhizobium lentis TaxID=1138194 RepID=A0A9Q3M7C5_9HYPH|nr:RNA 2'-phosphotransferase [Rhizobium lentis]MBX4954451.1 RNA 2'-phosphotransferase [Rhizobium lentis]MBX4972022.1 RNA 2'-phosphotransferase [Rhizobium lentis]MBX4984459.1 RNA 2'-phosphotransferase [Rhizobium lentis]MBX4996551.1 RNA 2'-phosphotransferase [Rhizobium lentis]MBX5002562.1 RNA 2'-phosphotransferase [Rhizobium lentis]
MTKAKLETEVSKYMSYVLRHAPEAAGLTLDGEGWVSFDELEKALASKYDVSRADIIEIVENNPKKRFTLADNRIRANQGHSIDVDLALKPVEPPAALFHGTSLASWSSIAREGLKKMQRHHVHLSADVETARIVAMRRKGEYVILRVDAARMFSEGHSFFVSDNGVWLTESVPVQFLSPDAGTP